MVSFNQYAHGVKLTLNLDFDPGTLPSIKLSISNTDGEEVITATEADAELDTGLGEVPASSGVFPIEYAFRAGELDTPGWFRAVLFLQDNPTTQLRVLTDGWFEVRAVPGVPPAALP